MDPLLVGDLKSNTQEGLWQGFPWAKRKRKTSFFQEVVCLATKCQANVGG